MAPRNFVAIFLALALGSAWAIDPLVGPGKAGAEKNEKGGIKGADAGEGPHKHFPSQYERRTDRPEEAIAKEKKEKEAKARQEEREAAKASAGSGR